jgi:hypothetical protein
MSRRLFSIQIESDGPVTASVDSVGNGEASRGLGDISTAGGAVPSGPFRAFTLLLPPVCEAGRAERLTA